MDPMKQIYLLLVCQGFYLGSVCQRWTIPSRITALIGSCVEIPCTYDPTGSSGASSPVWYLSADGPDLQILNTKDSSSVMEEYKDRTSLVPGDHSCTLRIDPVRREDGDRYYYPGITEDQTINAADKDRRFFHLSVTDIRNNEMYLPNHMTEGEATIIRCNIDHTCRSRPPSLQWNKPGQVQHQSVEISGGSWREESNLTYIPSYLDDGTTVRCTATYPNGQHFHESGTLRINYGPKNVTVTVLKKDEVMEGSNVTLQCNSFSKPDVYEYEWYRGKEKTKLSYTGKKIGIWKVTWDMEPYSCAAINAAGRGESALMEILVLYAATGVRITMNIEGEFTKMTCDFLNSRPDVTHYTWMKDGSILQKETEKTLTIDNNVENYGQYSCIAHNRAGNSSSEIYNKGSKNSFINSYGHVIIPVTIVTICLALLVYVYWRKKHKKLEGIDTDATYTDLKRSEITETYDQLKTEAAYTDLKISEITETYNQLKPVIPPDSAPVGSDVDANNVYENVHKQND